LRPAGRVATVAGLFLLGLTFPVLFGRPELLTLLSYGITASVVLLPLRAAKWLGFTAALALLGSTAVVRGAPDWSDTLLVGLLTMGIVSATQLTRANAQLRAARERVRELAVADERGRVARDLHDLLGHSLTTITLKTGLARRMLEGGKDGALDELREVELLSRQALAEVRATVTDFRRTSLAAELAGVRAALGSAGIKLVAPHAVDDVEVRLQQPFAFVVREAVTNVIRHSGATHCEIRLGPNWIEVTDDGPAAASATVRGNGLSGLAERLAAVGGRVDAGPGPGGGFVVRASVG
jgi:two-component system sensor histidine kinase DesK